MNCVEVEALLAPARALVVARLRQLRDEEPDVFARAPAVIACADVSEEAKRRVLERIAQVAAE